MEYLLLCSNIHGISSGHIKSGSIGELNVVGAWFWGVSAGCDSESAVSRSGVNDGKFGPRDGGVQYGGS